MAPAQGAPLGPAKNQPHRCTGVYRAGRPGRKVIISIARIKNLNALIARSRDNGGSHGETKMPTPVYSIRGIGCPSREPPAMLSMRPARPPLPRAV